MPTRAACSALLAALTLLAPGASADAAPPAIALFSAEYTVQTGGLKTARATVSLRCTSDGDYLYRQQTEAVGIVALFGKRRAVQTSRWRPGPDGGIRALEFRAGQPGGDDDANAHLLFDWNDHRVRNTGAGKHWVLAMPDGTLDPLVMTLALTEDVKKGRSRFDYPVAVRGRIKHYRFRKVGNEHVELSFGRFETIKLARTDESGGDRSWIWIAPALHYLPVRYRKRKSSGPDVDMQLVRLHILPPTAGDDCGAAQAASGS